jgi:hypothetical protein
VAVLAQPYAAWLADFADAVPFSRYSWCTNHIENNILSAMRRGFT